MNSTPCGHSSQAASPMEILSQEHRIIERVLEGTERMLNEGRIDADFIGKALDFFRNFADECHHRKEEDVLFPELEAAGIPRQGGPIGCMLQEHERGRSLVRTIGAQLEAAAGGDADAIELLRTAAYDYITLLREHISKEDNVLFVMAGHSLDAAKQASISARFATSACDSHKHERYLALADELSNWQFSVAAATK